MKVLQIANGYFVSNIYKLLFQELKKKGVVQKVYVPLNKNSKEINKDENVIVSYNFSNLDRLMYFSKQKKMYADIEQSVVLEEISIVHAHTIFSAGYVAMKLHEVYGIPYIVAVRNTDLNVFFKYMIHLRRIGIDILKNADKIIFISNAYKEQLLDEYIPNNIREELKTKICVIPNGISDLFLNNAKMHARNEKEIHLIYAGNIDRNKNIELTINAAKLLIEKGYSVKYTVVGQIKDNSYKRMIKDNSFISYHNKCRQEELIKLYSKADIFVMPSHNETFGLVYVEAMSQGLPVIYTRGQGFDGHFVEGEVGYSVNDYDYVELADRILDAFDKYDLISKRCVNEAMKFDWEKICIQYYELYRELTREE